MEDAANSSMEACYSTLHIDPIDASAIGEFLVNDSYTSTERTDPERLLSYINQTVNLTKAFSFPEVTLDVTDERAETIHTCDSIAILLILLLLFLTIMTVWAFKAFRFRVFHETGLALLYGTYAFKYNYKDILHVQSYITTFILFLSLSLSHSVDMQE